MRESGVNDCETPAFLLNIADEQTPQTTIRARLDNAETEQAKLARIQRNRALREAVKRSTGD